MANFCENCGSPLTNDNKFCPGCGAPAKQPEQDSPAAASAATPVNEGTLASAAAAGTAAAAAATGKMQDAFVAEPSQEPVRPAAEEPQKPGKPMQQHDIPQGPKESAFEQQGKDAPFTNRMPMDKPVQGGTGPKYEPDTNLISMFMRCDNRLNRKRYIMRLLALWVVGLASVMILGTLFNTYKIKAFVYLEFILVVVFLIAAVPLKIRRLHDLDRSGWWVLPVFVPVVHFLFILYLLFWKGTEGPNKYGPDPLEAQD